MIHCPCCSRKLFSECCEPIISDQSAPTALALMRSRYSAYSIGAAEYLVATTHSRTRWQYQVDDIRQWSESNHWTKLEIISVEHGRVMDSRGVVEFKAHFRDAKGIEQVHHERSVFLKEGTQWFYLEGKIDPQAVDLTKKISRNDPCLCGSGKKYKKCCA
ncbi:YchJ family protein [Reichenbachiella agariperforans]|uniref:YchJ family protein n=1 Tax=Reichenbachiella agariperforans TaxID=156994 RepID=UPI001C092412|nr:YchJ family protein [Reichenbachiella agariperforans]MBU2913252.1 YchJ family protein [Reichenbachiella agariperforans]